MFSKMKNYADQVELARTFTDAIYALYQSDFHDTDEVKQKIARFFEELKKTHHCTLTGSNKQTYVFCHILQYIEEEDEFYGGAKTNMRDLLNPFVHLVKLYDLFSSLNGVMAMDDKDIVPYQTYRKS